MAGIKNHVRPMQTRYLSEADRAERAAWARMRQIDRTVDALLYEPEDSLDGPTPDRPEIDTDEEAPS